MSHKSNTRVYKLKNYGNMTLRVESAPVAQCTRPWPAFGRQWPSWIVGRWPVREEKTTHVLARAFGAPLGGYWSSGGEFFLPLLVQNFSFCWLWILFQSFALAKTIFALAKTIFLPSKIIFLRYFLLFIGRWPVLEDIHLFHFPSQGQFKSFLSNTTDTTTDRSSSDKDRFINNVLHCWRSLLLWLPRPLQHLIVMQCKY